MTFLQHVLVYCLIVCLLRYKTIGSVALPLPSPVNSAMVTSASVGDDALDFFFAFDGVVVSLTLERVVFLFLLFEDDDDDDDDGDD